ncbi:MAG TPA: aspartate kinase [Vicinamibacteria bacterium]|nr:aspartate kinase [Vicinamibacteria bacterium]
MGRLSAKARGTPERRAPAIWKFGGASLADAAGMRRVAALVERERGPVVVVASALHGITDLLIEGAHRSAQGDAAAGPRVAARFLERHRALVRELIPRRRAAHDLLLLIDTAAREYRDLCRAVVSLRDLAPRTLDLMLARGERASSAVLAAALAESGRRAKYVDAAAFMVTDGRYGQATPDFAATRPKAVRALRPLLRAGVVPVVTGFIGAGPHGSLTTLGRGGTDLTATTLGRVLGARRVVLWKDVPGILTADPRQVPDARLIPQLHHREAAEVAFYGARVLHPRALIPLDGTRVLLEVRSFLEPDRPGTEVSGRKTLPKYPVKALATIAGQALVTVTGKGMVGVPGVAARTFTAVQAEGFSVSTIFQASSESSIGFTLAESEAPRAVAALRRAFKEELESALVDAVSARPGLAVVAVVGYGMAGTPGIAARVFAALATGGVNVIAIAQGSSERNISFVVTADQAPEATRRIHAAFQLSKIGGGRPADRPRTDVVLLGFGKVGRALADQLAAANGSLGVRVVGLLDRSGYVFEARGLSRARLLRLAQGKDEGEVLSRLGGQPSPAAAGLATIASHAVSRPVLVDVTAEDTGDMLRSALAHGFDLVLANKKPLAGPPESYGGLLSAAAAAGRRIRYEATVGAGLPILDTFRKLVDSGDRVLSMEGCVSGTLGFVLSAVGAGRPFSAAVREAMARGYTEPDPREDLSGQDVARKGLILARLLGYRGAPPVAEDLVPVPLRKVPLARFVQALPSLDEEWRRRVDRAKAQGQALRYVVRATGTSVRASLVAVPADSPVGALQGTRNLISFTTRRYRSEPLVITGPGAGPDVTAAGILNDIQYLAATT